MLGYIEFLNIPTKIAVILVGLFLALQVIGEILEAKGKIVPEIMKVRKLRCKRKAERDALSRLPEIIDSIQDVPETLKKVQTLLSDVNQHYNADNITKRDGWMKAVDDKLASNEQMIQVFTSKLDKNNEDTLELLIENKRSTIIDFAAYVIDDEKPVTREQFNRIFKIYNEYEDIIHKNGKTNGEVDIAYRIIIESYEKHMRSHTFIEEIRGYDHVN